MTASAANLMKEKRVKLKTGYEVPLDGDLLAIIEALYKEVTLGDGLNSSFETMRSEILSLIDQMSESDRRTYLAESLFLNSVTYENEMLSAYVRRLSVRTPSVAPKRANAKKKPTLKGGARRVTKKMAVRKTGKKKTR